MSLWVWHYLCLTFLKPLALFHSMLVAYAILVPTLCRNHRTRLHGFQQHCMADWRFYFFRWCLTKSLTGCWVECQAAVSAALVSVNFHSKQSIKLFFFSCEGPDIYKCKEIDQMFKQHCLNCLSFFLCNVAWSLWDSNAQGQDCISC